MPTMPTQSKLGIATVPVLVLVVPPVPDQFGSGSGNGNVPLARRFAHQFQSNSHFKEETVGGVAYRAGFNLHKAEQLSLWGSMGVTKRPASNDPRGRFEVAISWAF